VANVTHPSFRQPRDPRICLWRYMDLSKFVALLQERALVFARADKLGDSLSCVAHTGHRDVVIAHSRMRMILAFV
jgi:hypothetical protein